MSDQDLIQAKIQNVLRLHDDRLELLSAADRPKIGYMSIQTPEEVILAAGAIPFRLSGEHGSNVEEAGSRLSNNYCSYVLSCFGEGLSDVYGFADGVVFIDACDMRKRLSEVWKRNISSVTSYYVDHPSFSSPQAKEFFAKQLKKLIGKFEERYGCVIDDQALGDAIELCNKSRRLMQRLYEYKKRGRPALTGNESIGVVKSATTGLKDRFNDSLTELLDALDTTADPSAGNGSKRPRVMVSGSYFDHPEIVETIEGAGADLVCEDVTTGIKYFEGQISTDGDPLHAIANYYVDKHTSARQIDADIRVNKMFELIDEYEVDSVIYYVLKFCDTNLHDYLYIKEKIKEEKIPILLVESEHNSANVENLKTRIQTFLEPQMF